MSEISSTAISNEEWTELELPENALNLVLKLHHSHREARIWIGDGDPPEGINDPAMRIVRCDEPLTFSIEDGDAVYARIYAGTYRTGRVDLWAGDDSA
jgi:hypothetical protein